MLDRPRERLGLRGTFPLAQERLDDQVAYIPERHEAEKPSQQPERLEGIVEELIDEQSLEPLTANLIDHLARQAGWIDLGTLEILVPIGGFADQPALHIFLPERGPSIHTEAIEGERVERELGGQVE